MSDAIHIVDLAANNIVPADSLSGLWEQIMPLLKEGTVPSPKYIEFAQNLEERMRYGPGRPLALKTVQKRLEYPLEQAQTLTTAAWPYGLPAAEDERFSEPIVLHAVVLEAMKLDLTVFADSYGVAFLPGQQLISESADESEWAALLHEPSEYEDDDEEEIEAKPKMTKAQIIKRLVSIVGESVKPHGFVLSKQKYLNDKGKPEKNGYYFVKEIPDGWHHVRFGVRILTTGRIDFSLVGGGTDSYLHPILKEIFPQGDYARQPFVIAADYRVPFYFLPEFRDIFQRNIASGKWPKSFDRGLVFELTEDCNGHVFYEEEFGQYVNTMMEIGLPVLSKIKDYKVFWEEYVSDSMYFWFSDEHAIVAGFLLEDPRAERLVESRIANLKDDEWRKKSEEHYNHLLGPVRERVRQLSKARNV